MTTNEEKRFHELLKADVEKVARRKIAVKRDFEYLSAHIMDRTGAYISPITLRRFWGELAGGKYDIRPRRFTLDTIARYIGHSNYDGFLASCAGSKCGGSDFIRSEYVVSNTLKRGERIHISWEPGHYIVVEYLGCEMFSIVESFKSKLSVGDTFQVDILSHGEPLFLNRLIHNNEPPCRYVCGKNSGINFRIITDKANSED